MSARLPRASTGRADNPRDGFAVALRLLIEEHEAQITQLNAEIDRWRQAAQGGGVRTARGSGGPRAHISDPPPTPTADAELPRRNSLERCNTTASLVLSPARSTASASARGTESEPTRMRMCSPTKSISRGASARFIGLSNEMSKDGSAEEDEEEEEAPAPTLEMISDAVRGMHPEASTDHRGSREWRRDIFLFYLDTLIGLAIVLNTLLLGVSADLEPEWLGWVFIDAAFALTFSIELGVKLCLHGWRMYFLGPECLSNNFEALLVVLAVLEAFLAMVSRSAGDSSGSGSVLSLFRVVRLIRVVRVLRVMRLELFNELKVMVRGTLGGMRTLLWSTLLIILPVYSVSLVLRETLGSVTEVGHGAEYFSSVPRSFFSVFRCIVVGECADSSGRPLFVLVTEAYGWGFGLIFCITAVFMSFGLFNVIVAMFVENVVTAAKSKNMQARKERLRDKVYFAKKMDKLLKIICEIYDKRSGAEDDFDPRSDSDGWLARQRWMEITPEFFNEFRYEARVQKIFDELDLADEDQFNLFDTLDADKSGTIDLEELCIGIQKLRGEACRSDIISINIMIQNVRQEMKLYMSSLARRVFKVDESLAEVRKLQEEWRDTC